jgi:FkbM family methyltransferase
MLMALSNIVNKYQLKITGVIHIGAHYGQECRAYENQGIKNMLFFEPVAKSFKTLMRNIPNVENVKAYRLALGNMVGEMDMYVETDNKGMSSSLLEPGTHLTIFPSIEFDKRERVKVDKLDNIEFDRRLFNMINIDVQGYELEVFKGAVKALETIDIIYTEVNTEDVYKGCCHVEELDSFLKKFGFIRITTKMYYPSWGDALYLKY